MKWIKKGFIFKHEGHLNWAKGYAQVPRPFIMKDRIRIFYAGRFFDSSKLPISQTSLLMLKE